MTRIRRTALRAFELPLRAPLETAHGAIASRTGWLVEIEDEEGLLGFGEATPLPDFGTEDLSACRQMLERRLADLVENEAGAAAAEASGRIGSRVEAGSAEEATPCAVTALEAALGDLAAKRKGRTLASELRSRAGLSGRPAASVATQALVGGSDPEDVFRGASASKRAGFNAFKLKLSVSASVSDPARDIERVAALREAVGGDALLRLDANEAWTLAEARRALAGFAKFAIDFVEQPVAREDFAGLKELSEEAAIDVAADEALQGRGLSTCLESRAAKILVVKPAALGGCERAIALFARAHAEGLRLIWSTLIDGAVGRALPLALAAGLGPEHEVHGLGTAPLLASDLSPAAGGEARLIEGRLHPSTGVGIGFVPSLPNSAPVFEARSS